MRKRMIIMLVGVVLFLAALGMVKFKQIQAAVAQASSFQPPPEAVTTVVARVEQWPNDLNSVGTVEPERGVMVSADLPGIVESISFESGTHVAAGEVLAKLDTSQERAQLASAEAQRELAEANLRRMTELRDEGVISQAEYDQAAATAKQSTASVGEIRATIERKTIRAPFAGIVGIRQVNLGQYLAPGTPVVPLQSLDPIHVDFAIPQQQVSRVKLGAEVGVTADGLPGPITGRVTAVDSVIDEATRNVQVQATFDNPRGVLRPGMFVEAQLALGASSSAIALPASAISYAPYGDSVFVVEQMKSPEGQPYRGVRQQFVKLGPARGDLVAVLDGVKAGEEVVTSGGFKLRNGAAVQVNNEIQPASDRAPQPEDS
ncbi:MAG: efflux RND transporter periplasmic adaptor subunit [Acidobacteria bacterium]|nr:efflux RND transporter periplasmic adaptor subunit [Acidobacteriota bacterium]